MRGRKPAGPQYMEGLEGSTQAKERLTVVLLKRDETSVWETW